VSGADEQARRQRRRTTIADFVERAHAVLEEVDYYRILGLAHDADGDAVRAAYYKLAALLHPDVHGDETTPAYREKLTAVFSRLAEAYRVLIDPGQREAYDRGLAEGEVRMSTGIKVRPRPEELIADVGARRFYRLGMEALAAGNGKSAAINLRMALSMEDCAVIRDALASCEPGKGRP
jgi:curved DNA-binding protein CbpA